MFETYYPEKFCREFAELKGNSLQLTMIMATVKGLKPVMDDWIPAERFDAYKKICRRYGLFVMPDAVFSIVSAKDVPSGTIGRGRLTTTRAFGAIYRKGVREGSVHVFISRSRSALQKAFAGGWYPLIIKKRVVDRPLADAFKFGHALGYPGCCVHFFRQFNNWCAYSHLYETYRNTPRGKASYLCNPFNKDVTYSYIYHMPCSYSCAQTIRWVSAIRKAIFSEEPVFAESIDRHLRRPYLVFYEKKHYAFDGSVRKNRLFYQKVYFTGAVRENNLYEQDLQKGDCIEIADKDALILKRGRLVKRIRGSLEKFAPESPFIIDFS